MAYVEPPNRATGLVVTSGIWNQDVAENQRSLFPDGATGNTWSPVLEATTANPGTSAVAGVEFVMGVVQFCWARWVLSSGGTGDYKVTLPSTALGLTASVSAGKGQAIGSFQIVDDSPVHMLGGTVLLRNATTAHFMSDSVVHGTSSGVVSSTTPRTWATGDVLSFYAMYPIA